MSNMTDMSRSGVQRVCVMDEYPYHDNHDLRVSAGLQASSHGSRDVDHHLAPEMRLSLAVHVYQAQLEGLWRL